MSFDDSEMALLFYQEIQVLIMYSMDFYLA